MSEVIGHSGVAASEALYHVCMSSLGSVAPNFSLAKALFWLSLFFWACCEHRKVCGHIDVLKTFPW